ncbi:hypothetical protein IFM89_031980 [Coptis chinensis]|uniref:Uncharacterized protein n=1 Tax=Coptis chinensis TaxID=261450 RepID=A0A835HGP9_9MAGN|nr:hypothetical protein IFM89_031980 [Coptis chinensis]
MLSFELWYSMGLVLTVGYFANPIVSVASFSICLNCLNWDLMFMLGMSEAASALLLICGAALSMAFTYKADVSKAVSVLIPFLAISVLLNGVQPILSGFGLSFMTSMGVAGIWCGMICGFLLQTLVLITLFVMTDWETEVTELH